MPATACALIALLAVQSSGRNIQDFGVRSGNSPSANATALQRAIDWASPRGAALYVPPTEEPYQINGGIKLRINVSLVGVNGPTGRGTRHPSKPQPVGSVFAIVDATQPFLTVESATQVKGIQFWYPEQSYDDPAKVIQYPPTIQTSRANIANGVALRDLTFYGEWVAMDFAAVQAFPCELLLIENCYGYPLSGIFLRVERCYDVPRILNCHVNPANTRLIRGSFSPAMVDSVIARKNYAFRIDNTDNAQLSGVFAFGVYGGIHLGSASYGQISNFAFDCVTNGILKQGDSDFNRNWMASNGSIIANVGAKVEDIHPVIVEGKGHLSLTNVEAFSGKNPALTTLGQSHDFLLVRGDGQPTIALTGCRIRNYASENAITLENPRATVTANASFDRNLAPLTIPPKG